MDEEAIRRLFLDFQRGDTTIDDAVERLRRLPFHDLRFAKVDHHRSLRKGFPEVIYCPGKSPEQIDSIAKEILKGADTLLATRAGRGAYEMIRSWCPDAVYHEEARAITVERRPLPRLERLVAVVSAGTSDIPVAEEAAVTAEITGSPVERIYDVGVAGLHRLLDHRGEIMRASVVVAVAGMEGALPSVVAGMVAAPVIAVPTSVGYGASFGGLASLLAMMNSCASGVVVVNIDNGFGAGYAATLMNRLACKESRGK